MFRNRKESEPATKIHTRNTLTAREGVGLAMQSHSFCHFNPRLGDQSLPTRGSPRSGSLARWLAGLLTLGAASGT